MDSKFFALDDHTPYSDRKHMRVDDAPLEMEVIVAIQRMDCEGKRPHEIYEAFTSQCVTMDQIMALIDPPDERAHAGQHRRHDRAGLGHAAIKAGFPSYKGRG